jgi:raffinose/stachyose/melibiose transport system substrate-binding protein
MARNRSHSGVTSSISAARLLAALIVTILVAGCASPGSVSSPTSAASVAATAAASVAEPSAAASSSAASSGSAESPSASASAASASASAGASTAAGGPTCGTEPVELIAEFETGFPTVPALADEFHKQFPNVTFKVSQDQFANLMTSTPRLLSSDNPPDLIRLPTLISLVKDDLLKNLDDYATAFGWDKWPAAQLVQNRVNTDGTRGSGSLYAMGLNNSLTGVFYNKKLAQQIGMTEPPKSVADFEALLGKAKSAGLLPIMVWNSAKSGGGLAFPLQQLMAAYGPTQPINDWIFQKKDATIDTPANATAAQHLQQWITSGYFPKDANAIEYTDANARFGKGEGVFMFNGDWQDGGYDKDQPGNVGFFVFPPAQAGGTLAAMSSPLTYGIAKTAKHADCAAFFLNWVATNDKAREINVKGFGSNPGGPTDLPIPPVAEGSVTKDTLAAGAEVAKANGAMDFIANATGSIFAKGWTPELQNMVGGKQDAAGLLKSVQAEYAKEIAAGS